MNKIIFVCTGNTCRSPMAEIILKKLLKDANITNVKISSAGLMAVEGEKMSENSKIALKELGFRLYGFKSKRLTPNMVKKANMVICMTNSHKQSLSAYGFNNVYTLAEVTGTKDVIDPYGYDLSVYKKTAEQIKYACEIILKEIKKVRGEE
ncbi:MAG: low molecular weight protein arginine phosphatase [Clostridia bacterium]|nr:low molecular weight protein arginine phosphatase [Clostridia bacterium]